MKLVARVIPEPSTATGGSIAIVDEETGIQVARLSVFNVQLPSGNRLCDDADREYIRELTAAVVDAVNGKKDG